MGRLTLPVTQARMLDQGYGMVDALRCSHAASVDSSWCKDASWDLVQTFVVRTERRSYCDWHVA